MDVIVRALTVGLLAGVLLMVGVGDRDAARSQQAEDDQPSNRMICGECPEGYAKTGVTTAPDICKEGDPILVQCVPVGSRLLAVCGSCPDGYTTVGTSMVPSRCGSEDNGQMSQCQLDE